MRALALGTLALAAVGCSVPPSQSSVREQSLPGIVATGPDIYVNPPPGQTCLTLCFVLPLTDAEVLTDDPWAQTGDYGYVTPIQMPDGSYLVIGWDHDLAAQQEMWARSVSLQSVDHYQHVLPKTVPFGCGVTPDVGQTGSLDVPTGGGNRTCHDLTRVCFDTAWYNNLCACSADTAAQTCSSASAKCGTNYNNCLDPVDCASGSCGDDDYVCRNSECVCANKCPTGFAQDSACDCIKIPPGIGNGGNGHPTSGGGLPI